MQTPDARGIRSPNGASKQDIEARQIRGQLRGISAGGEEKVGRKAGGLERGMLGEQTAGSFGVLRGLSFYFLL